MTRLRKSAAILFVLLLTSCAHKVRPGAYNSLDDATYTFLMVSQSTLNAARAEMVAGTLPQTLMPAYNKAVDVYLRTRTIWLSYRERKATDKDLSDALAAIQVAMLELNKVIGRKP
jgi:hypothetical protein